MPRTSVTSALPIWKLPLSWLLFELSSCTEKKLGSVELAVDNNAVSKSWQHCQYADHRLCEASRRICRTYLSSSSGPKSSRAACAFRKAKEVSCMRYGSVVGRSRSALTRVLV